jgi:hypothetical protein
MNYGLQVLIVLVAAVTGMCSIHKASEHQQRSLEAKCHCVCVRDDDNLNVPNAALGPDDHIPTPVFDEWLAKFGTGELTMAWGGGFWRCAVGEKK